MQRDLKRTAPLTIGVLALLCALPVLAHEPTLTRLPEVFPTAQQVQHTEPADEPLLIEAETSPVEELIVDEEALVAEELPPEAEPEPVYTWYDVRYWVPRDGWTASVEVGLNGTSGNSQTLSQRIGADAKRTVGPHKASLNVIYNRATTEGTETANNAFAKFRYDRDLGESRWSMFTLTTLEHDAFRAFDLRVAANGGFGYALIKNEATELVGRFGSGVSHEIGGPDDSYRPEAVFGIDFEHQLTKRQKLSWTSDYYPEWTDFDTYRINTTAAWEMLLDEELNLSLKAGVLSIYDSHPEGREPHDLNYSLLLLWKI